VHGIVHEHGGHVVVASSPGEGANFRVLWPAMDAEQASAATARDRTRDVRTQRPSLQGSVLVVDDEEAVGEFMRELLGTWGINAVFVSRPEAALELIAGAPATFDLVITDQSMPRMTGLELARRLRQLRADLPVLLYTGFGDGLAGDALDSAQLAAVIRKPVDPALLGLTLARYLAPKGADFTGA
jgi:two-component system, cell cycle sensor histidine kinase and response regulator CckA